MLRKGTRCHGTAIISRTCQRRAIPLHFEGERERKEKRDEINRISWLTVDLLSHARTPRVLVKRFSRPIYFAAGTVLVRASCHGVITPDLSARRSTLSHQIDHFNPSESAPQTRHSTHIHTRVERAHVYRIDAYTRTHICPTLTTHPQKLLVDPNITMCLVHFLL